MSDAADQRLFELNWYRKNGAYPERITKDADGKEYVVGDFSWNINNPDKPENIEYNIQHAQIFAEYQPGKAEERE